MTLPRGFPPEEFRARTARAQAAMAREDLAALLLTTEADIRYVSGFLTRFWESPTRPWFLILPAAGDPVAVIPSVGAHLMGRTWLTDIRTWRAPDPEDDGVILLADTLAELVPPGGRVGVPRRGHASSNAARRLGASARAPGGDGGPDDPTGLRRAHSDHMSAGRREAAGPRQHSVIG